VEFSAGLVGQSVFGDMVQWMDGWMNRCIIQLTLIALICVGRCTVFNGRVRLIPDCIVLCIGWSHILQDNTRWFKYDRDWFVCTFVQISPGHIWTTLYYRPIAVAVYL